MRSLMPDATFRLWERLEAGLAPWMEAWAMFALVVVEKKNPEFRIQEPEAGTRR